MNTQTFRSTDVMTALEDVQKKLGPDAIVLSVRQVPQARYGKCGAHLRWKWWQCRPPPLKMSKNRP